MSAETIEKRGELAVGVPLQVFCDERRLSLRSRVELLEQLCSVVVAAHARNVAFRDFTSRSVKVDYQDGSLALSLGETIGFEERASKSGAFSTAELLRATNVVFLGHVAEAIIGADLLRRDASLSEIVGRAQVLDRERRFASAAQLRDRLRAWLADETAERFSMRWSWA